MKWNASALAALILLAGCGGGRNYDYGTEAAPPPVERGDGLEARPPGAPYALPQAAPPTERDLGTRPADQYRNRDADQPVPADTYARPADTYDPPAYQAPAYQAPQPRSTYAPPAQAYPQPVADPGAGMPGPRGSSQAGAGEARYDEVGYAGVRGVAGGDANGGAVVAVARSVPVDTYLEVTSLDTGRTILVLVTGTMPAGADHPIDLSPGAARLLGGNGTIPVRVRRVTPSPQDQSALRAGQPAGERVDAPPVLLAALRKHLAGAAAAQPQPQPSYQPPSRAPVRAAPATRGGFYVQVAALSNGGNAQGLAQSLGGFVKPGGGLYRVQLGPFRTAREAEAARADAARRGYGDARVFAQN